jgi:hypothetical protein
MPRAFCRGKTTEESTMGLYPPCRSVSIPSLVLLLAAGVGVPALARAQAMEIKPARIEYEFYPTAGVQGPGAQAGAEARFQSARASLSVPMPVGETALLIPGLKYQVLDVGQSDANAASDSASVEALHSLALSMGWFQPLGSGWSSFVQVGGGLAGDLTEDIESDDWVVSAQLLALWNVTGELTLGGGVGYDRRTGEVAPLPLVAVNWQPRSDLLLRSVLPQFLSLRYRPEQLLTLALDSGLEGERYHLSESRAGVAHAEVAYSVIKVGPSATLHWTSWFHTRLAGGVALHRRFELYDDDTSLGDLEVGRGPFAGLEIWFGPSGWSSDAPETALATASAPDERASDEP